MQLDLRQTPLLEAATARLTVRDQSGSLMAWKQRCLQWESPCFARSCGHFAGNVDCVGVIDPRFLQYRICRCIYLRSFLGSISQGRISSTTGQTLEPPFVSALSLEHAGYSSAGLHLASLFSPPSSGVPAVLLVSATVPLAVQSLVSVFASAVALDCLSVLLLACYATPAKLSSDLSIYVAGFSQFSLLLQPCHSTVNGMGMTWNVEIPMSMQIVRTRH